MTRSSLEQGTASPLRPGDKEVLRMLCNEILPWMIAGRRARRQWFVILASVYSYGAAVAAGLAGIGGAPFVPDGKVTLAAVEAAFSGASLWVGVVALILWVVVGIVVQQHDVARRALFARDCSKAMQKLYADLYDALEVPYPLPRITPIKGAVRRARSEAIDKEVWPYNPPQPNAEDIGPELHRLVADIREKFMPHWVDTPGQVDQAPPPQE